MLFNVRALVRDCLGGLTDEGAETEDEADEGLIFGKDPVGYPDDSAAKKEYEDSKLCSDNNEMEGNTEGGHPNLLNSPDHPNGSNYVVPKEKNESSRVYKLSLSARATEEDQTAFDNYKKEIESSGWSLTPMQTSVLEKVAYVVIPKGSDNELHLATYLTESILKKAFKETYGRQ